MNFYVSNGYGIKKSITDPPVVIPIPNLSFLIKSEYINWTGFP